MLNADLTPFLNRESLRRRPFIGTFNRTLRGQADDQNTGYLGKRLDDKDFNKTIEQSSRLCSAARIHYRYLEEYIVRIFYHQKSA